MRHLLFFAGVAALFLAAGCVKCDYVGREFAPTPESEPVAYFRNRGEIPPGDFRIIGRATVTAPDGTDGYDIRDLLLEKARNAVADVFLIGGRYEPYYDIVAGPLAQEVLSRFHFDRAFIGCFGVSLEKHSAYTMEMECMSLKTIALQNAGRRYLLLDDSKLTKAGFYAIADLDRFDAVVCNRADTLPEKLPNNFVLV